VNLRAMDTLRETFGFPVGYSHHTPGTLALLAAAARGAEILEFHFTDEPAGRSFRDHAISLTAADVRQLVAQLVTLHALLGDGVKRPQASEIESDHIRSFRRAVYTRRDYAPGERLDIGDLVCLRPNHGIDARDFGRLPGTLVIAPIRAGEAIQAGAVDWEEGR
jgi:sialic acid synthase SpsE